MKYIIEIENEPFGRNDDPFFPHGMDELYRAKGFKSLVFDQDGLDKLTPYTEPDRQDIEDEVWEFAWEVLQLDLPVFREIFGYDTDKMDYREYKSKYEAWKKQKDEIRVGCEVHHKGIPEIKIYVTDMDDNSFGGFALCRVKDVCDYGDRFSECNVHQYKPTGRVFPNIVELLKKMGEEK